LRADIDPWILIRRGIGQERTEDDGTVVGQITSELSNRSILSYWKQRMLDGSEV